MRNKVLVMLLLLFAASAQAVAAQEALELQPLVDEALRHNRDLLAAESRWKAATFRIGQATSLPDPMVMVGYQNEGWDKYTFGEMEGAQWMYSLSQMFPFPGKRGLKGEMAGRDAESAEAMYRATRLGTVSRVKELYYDLFLAYKDIDIVQSRTALFSRIEAAALARYSSGMAPQQEVLMAQTEKYMLLEKETMLRQKLQSLEAMLNSAVGRDVNAPLGRPSEPAAAPFPYSYDELASLAVERSPELHSRAKMIAAADARVGMAKKEFFPDVTVAASVFKRTGADAAGMPFEDMWSLTATINIPLYFRAKQQAVLEAKSLTAEAAHELDAVKLMVSSGIRDNFSMLKSAEKLMDLYKQGLIPKTYQDFQSAMAGYAAGKVEEITVISRLKALLDYETLYWAQFVEREKAVARIESLAGIGTTESVEKKE
jgi:outer membrane protein TolC